MDKETDRNEQIGMWTLISNYENIGIPIITDRLGYRRTKYEHSEFLESGFIIIYNIYRRITKMKTIIMYVNNVNNMDSLKYRHGHGQFWRQRDGHGELWRQR